MSSSNITERSDISFFNILSNTSYDINQMIHQKGSLVFSSEKYSQKPITFDDMCLTVAIAYSIIYEGLYFNMSHKTIIMKVLKLARNI